MSEESVRKITDPEQMWLFPEMKPPELLGDPKWVPYYRLEIGTDTTGRPMFWGGASDNR